MAGPKVFFALYIVNLEILGSRNHLSSDKGHSKRGQTSQRRTSQKYSYRKSPLKEDNLSTKDKMAGPKSVLIKRFHCKLFCTTSSPPAGPAILMGVKGLNLVTTIAIALTHTGYLLPRSLVISSRYLGKPQGSFNTR